MKHIIVGTAGHVDHGKTTLIKALTGIDADRLKEEKQRGLTIDIGFAYFDLPSGRRAGIVDVPGHERFIKNMLAGAIGIDIVLLVIAADEGIMPQTREHLDILSFLNVKKGIVVLTKSDLVEEEWLELVEQDIFEQLENTFLNESPIIPVSSIEGQGLDVLAQTIDTMTSEMISRNTTRPFRLPIDRAFSVKGFGTVVTGTLVEGVIVKGQTAELMPLGQSTRIRNIQVHGENKEEAYAGQRVALNLADVEITDCPRGSVLAEPGLLQPTMMLDVHVRLLSHSPRILRNWDRVRLYMGTSEVLARVVLLDRDELYPGEDTLAQLRLEEAIVALREDHFVLRFYSPMETIGGGEVVDARPVKKKRFNEKVIEELELRAAGSPEAILDSVIEDLSAEMPSKQIAHQKSGLRLLEFEEAWDKLIQNDEIIELTVDNTTYVLGEHYLAELSERLSVFLEKFHASYPLRVGIAKAEVQEQLAPAASTKLFNKILLLLVTEKQVEIVNEYVKRPQHAVVFNGKWHKLKDAIIQTLNEAKYMPPNADELAEKIGNDEREVEEVLAALAMKNELIKINEEQYLTKQLYDDAITRIQSFMTENQTIDLGQFRDLLSTSRKYALPLLEHFDSVKFTKRIGNERVLYPSWKQK